MKLLFVCKHNRFRSKIAEPYFNKKIKNKNMKASSSGIFKDVDVADSVVEIGKELGLKIDRKSRGLERKNVKSQDLVIIVADNVPKSIFKKIAKKIKVWKIKDTD